MVGSKRISGTYFSNNGCASEHREQTMMYDDLNSCTSDALDLDNWSSLNVGMAKTKNIETHLMWAWCWYCIPYVWHSLLGKKVSSASNVTAKYWQTLSKEWQCNSGRGIERCTSAWKRLDLGEHSTFSKADETESLLLFLVTMIHNTGEGVYLGLLLFTAYWIG